MKPTKLRSQQPPCGNRVQLSVTIACAVPVVVSGPSVKTNAQAVSCTEASWFQLPQTRRRIATSVRKFQLRMEDNAELIVRRFPVDFPAGIVSFTEDSVRRQACLSSDPAIHIVFSVPDQG